MKLKKLLDFAFLAWIFVVFFTLPTAILDLYEPEWVEVKSSVKQVKLTYEFIDYEKQPQDFFKNYSTAKPQNNR
jgi:hypothetical protein